MKTYIFIAAFLSTSIILGGCAGTNRQNQYCDFSVNEIATIRQQAEAGDAKMQLSLAKIYNAGVCLDRDTRIVQQLILEAAEQGDANAQYDLGSGYDFGIYGFDKDPVQALHWYRLAAKQDDRQAQYAIGRFYHRGTGVDQDMEQARSWYQKAADQGHYSAGTTLEKLNCEANLPVCRKPLTQEKKQQFTEDNSFQKEPDMGRKRPETRERRLAWLSSKQRSSVKEGYGTMAIVVNAAGSKMENENASITKALAAPFTGAGVGTLGGLYMGTCAGYCPTTIGAAVGSAIGLVGGFFAGAATMTIELSERGAVSRLSNTYQTINISEGLQRNILQLGNTVLANELVGAEFMEPTPSVRDIPSPQSSTDTILVIDNVRSGIRANSSRTNNQAEQSTEFFIAVNSRLIRVSDNTVLEQWNLQHQIQEVDVRDWEADDAKAFRAVLEVGYDQLTDQLLSSLLDLPNLSALIPKTPGTDSVTPATPDKALVSTQIQTDSMDATKRDPGQNNFPAIEKAFAGLWRGQIYVKPTFPYEVEILIDHIDSDSATGFVIREMGGGIKCQGAAVTLKPLQNNVALISMDGPFCRGSSKISFANNKLKGKIRIEGHYNTIVLNRAVDALRQS